MLSNYEYRILGELELELTRRSSWPSRAAQASRLPIALSALVASIIVSTVLDLPLIAATLMVAGLGVIVGWLLVGVVRRNVMGPRIRRKLGLAPAPGTSVRRQR